MHARDFDFFERGVFSFFCRLAAHDDGRRVEGSSFGLKNHFYYQNSS